MSHSRNIYILYLDKIQQGSKHQWKTDATPRFLHITSLVHNLRASTTSKYDISLWLTHNVLLSFCLLTLCFWCNFQVFSSPDSHNITEWKTSWQIWDQSYTLYLFIPPGTTLELTLLDHCHLCFNQEIDILVSVSWVAAAALPRKRTVQVAYELLKV